MLEIVHTALVNNDTDVALKLLMKKKTHLIMITCNGHMPRMVAYQNIDKLITDQVFQNLLFSLPVPSNNDNKSR